METISDCFKSILIDDKETSRISARRVRKLIYTSISSEPGELQRIIETAPDNYAKISELFRQEDFVIALSTIYFLRDEEVKPDFLFDWLFELLKHKNGNIRLAAVRMIGHELGGLTVHLRFPNDKWRVGHNLRPEEADRILKELYLRLDELLRNVWKPAYKKYKYVSSLPSSPYKSVQMLLSYLEDDCGKEYMNHLAKIADEEIFSKGRHHLIQKVTVESVDAKALFFLKQSALKNMRSEMENMMFPEFSHHFSNLEFKDLVDRIYSHSQSFPELIQQLLNNDEYIRETDEYQKMVLDLISTAWNIYPHKELEGYSPYEIIAMQEISDILHLS